MSEVSSPSASKAVRVQKLLEEGSLLIQGKLFNQAMMRFKDAHYLAPQPVYARLQKIFAQSLKSMDWEAAFILGRFLITINDQDPNLITHVANAGRRVAQTVEANGLYLKALELNKDFLLARLNYAASLAQLELYNEQVQRALAPFFELGDIQTPGFRGEPDFVAEARGMIKPHRKSVYNQEYLALLLQRHGLKEDGADFEAKKLALRLEMHKKRVRDENYAQVVEVLRNNLKVNWRKKSLAEGQLTIQEDTFNLGIYALRNLDSDLAMEQFLKLKEKACKFEELETMILLAEGLDCPVELRVKAMLDRLDDEPHNRLLHVNLGLLYKNTGNWLEGYKHLLIAANLLKHSEGLYLMEEMVQRADQYFSSEDYKQALFLYQEVAKQADNPKVAIKIGDCYLALGKQEQACKCYLELHKMEVDADFRRQILLEKHDQLVKMAQEAREQGKNHLVMAYYKMAIQLAQVSETYRQIADFCEKNKDPGQAAKFRQEHLVLVENERKEERERERKALLDQGKLLMHKKDYMAAISTLEKAFAIEMDKDVFMLLAHLFKNLKQQRRLHDLLHRWKKHVEYLEKKSKADSPEEFA